MRRRGVLAMGAVLVLAACGGGDDDASSGSSGDGDSAAVVTCEVLTADVVGDALGTDVIAETMTTPSGGTDPVGCSYTSDSGDLRVLATARFGEKYYGGIDSPARTDPVAIDGLGDEAFADDGMVTFLSGEWTGSVSSSAGNVPDDDLEAVARALESKLP
ncbi:hypothetical protein [Actinospongicola halichondriae]|uniref:hypothetical protein n=1 Tax=Actinospongicola halichondriae TaxID=3236844 RepID=UPI003D523AC1